MRPQTTLLYWKQSSQICQKTETYFQKNTNLCAHAHSRLLELAWSYCSTKNTFHEWNFGPGRTTMYWWFSNTFFYQKPLMTRYETVSTLLFPDAASEFTIGGFQNLTIYFRLWISRFHVLGAVRQLHQCRHREVVRETYRARLPCSR